MYASEDWSTAVYLITESKGTSHFWGKDPFTGQTTILSSPMDEGEMPAYDLAYLLDMVKSFEPSLFYQKGGVISKEPTWGIVINDNDGMFTNFDDNPSNAVCKLIVQLNKEGFWK